jgi:hypothetical protein
MPTDPGNLAASIRYLSSPDAGKRERAAYELFRLGCSRVDPILKKWLGHAEFRSLAAPREGGLLTIGVAVQPATFETIRKCFGDPKLAEVPSDQNVREFELVFAHGVRLDVLTPQTLDPEAPISKFLARFGEGIQQVECEVRDVSRATEIVRRQFGLEPLYPETRAGANQTRVNFFLVPVSQGSKLLIELVETTKKSKSQSR